MICILFTRTTTKRLDSLMNCGPEKDLLNCESKKWQEDLLAGGVLGDGLGALRDGVLGEFTGQEKSDSGLHLATGDGRALVVVRQTGSLGGDALEDVIHEGVHDGHGLGGDTSVRVNLLQDFVDVDGEGLLALAVLALLLVRGTNGLLGFAGLLVGFTGAWWGHV